jgi:hypothetical protein
VWASHMSEDYTHVSLTQILIHTASINPRASSCPTNWTALYFLRNESETFLFDFFRPKKFSFRGFVGRRSFSTSASKNQLYEIIWTPGRIKSQLIYPAPAPLRVSYAWTPHFVDLTSNQGDQMSLWKNSPKCSPTLCKWVSQNYVKI